MSYLYTYIHISPHTITMPSIQIYLDEELFEFVKNDKSKIIQQALKEYKEKHADKEDCSTPMTDTTDAPA